MLAAKDAMFNGGFVKFYTGPKPTNPDTALSSQVLLLTLNYAATAFSAPTISGGFAVANGSFTSNSGTVGGSGTNTPVFARAYESDGVTVIDDYTVGLTGSGSDFMFPTVTWSAGLVVTLSSDQNEEPVD